MSKLGGYQQTIASWVS